MSLDTKPTELTIYRVEPVELPIDNLINADGAEVKYAYVYPERHNLDYGEPVTITQIIMNNRHPIYPAEKIGLLHTDPKHISRAYYAHIRHSAANAYNSAHAMLHTNHANEQGKARANEIISNVNKFKALAKNSSDKSSYTIESLPSSIKVTPLHTLKNVCVLQNNMFKDGTITRDIVDIKRVTYHRVKDGTCVTNFHCADFTFSLDANAGSSKAGRIPFDNENIQLFVDKSSAIAAIESLFYQARFSSGKIIMRERNTKNIKSSITPDTTESCEAFI